ncbi:hypothetical protein SAMN05421833_102465 [Microbispora rosea]|uniref:Uncharacterized protein n=2 Tax=Microbispora rosea TaxID=58117 RepID=A0A1N6TSI3_9ACTN|nr:hypothetical protein Mro03_01370 [Microbispora rosea subsp. rosea]SIQ56322.1 hypothetical protein SAMN05421833_102465 [Microbispora rosea]
MVGLILIFIIVAGFLGTVASFAWAWADSLDVPPAIVIGAALAIVIGAFIAWAVADSRRLNRRVQQADEDPGERLRERIHNVNQAFGDAAALMDELRRDLEAQQAARESLLEEAERQQRLLNLNKDEAENIRRILVGETKATILAERRREWMFFGLGFVASAVASIPIGIWVNHIS